MRATTLLAIALLLAAAIALAAADAPAPQSAAPSRSGPAMRKIGALRLRLKGEAAAEAHSALAVAAEATLQAAAHLPSKVNRRGAGGKAGRAGGGGGQSGRKGGQSGRKGGDAAGNGGQSGRKGGDAAGTGGQSGRKGGDASGVGGQSGRKGGDLPVSPVIGSAPPDASNVMTLMGGQRNWPVQVYLRNQGDAATCWAHSAVTLLELRQQMAPDYNRLKDWYSVDQVVQCVPHDGAGGGSPLDAIEFLLFRQRMTDVQVRAGVPITCNLYDWGMMINPTQSQTSGRFPVLALKPCVDPGENCARMAEYEYEMDRQYVDTPMLVYVDASEWHTYKPTFTSSQAATFEMGLAADYTGVVFPAFKCSMDPLKGDHIAILLGTVTCARTKKKYWRVYNSWGKEWGVNGYIYLPYEVNACGLANYPVGLADSLPLPRGIAGTGRGIGGVGASRVLGGVRGALLMAPKSLTREQAMATLEFQANGGGLAGGKEVWEAMQRMSTK